MRRSSAVIPSPSLALALCLFTGTANAQSVDALLQEGHQLRVTGQYEPALERFTRAWELTHTPRSRYHMAVTEQALGRWSVAAEHLQEVLDSARDPWVQQNRETLETAMANIRAHTGRLEVRGGVAGAEVLFNRRSLGRLPMTRPAIVDVGTGVLELHADGYHPFSRPVTISAGSPAIETVELVPTGAPAIRSPGAPTETSDVRRTLAWVTATGAVVGLGVGLAGSVLNEVHVANFEARCPRDANNLFLPEAPTSCTSELEAAQTREQVYQAMAISGYVVGGVLAVTSAVLFVLSSRDTTRTAATRHAVCNPSLGLPGFSCAVTF